MNVSVVFPAFSGALRNKSNIDFCTVFVFFFVLVLPPSSFTYPFVGASGFSNRNQHETKKYINGWHNSTEQQSFSSYISCFLSACRCLAPLWCDSYMIGHAYFILNGLKWFALFNCHVRDFSFSDEFSIFLSRSRREFSCAIICWWTSGVPIFYAEFMSCDCCFLAKSHSRTYYIYHQWN